MPFTEFRQHFPGLCHALEQARIAERIGQAYLVVGDEIASLERFGRALAQTAGCQTPNPSGAACGHCPVCRHFQKNSYTELYTLFPESKSRIISIQAMREFENNLGLVAQPGYLKVGLILDADCMNEDAENAFLKTLEEPPPKTMLILLTTRPRKLLPTIRSRCQTILLLRNKKNYDLAIKEGFFTQLSRLRPQAGVKTALDVAFQIGEIFKKFHDIAEKTVDENWDERWDYVSEDNASMKKKLDELKKVKADSEYMRLREEFFGALQAWFQQCYLLAEGVSRKLLPHPEMLIFWDDAKMNPASVEESEQIILWAADFANCLKANVDESLATEVFCLQVCEKKGRVFQQR